MRIKVLSFSLSLTLIGAVSLAAGCTAATSADSFFRGGNQSEGAPAPPQNNADTTQATFDGGVDAGLKLANPLCGASADRCMPDDDGSKTTYGQRCASPPPDGGMSLTADASTEASGCRLAKQSDGSYAPQCFEGQSDRRGTDGVACTSGADCAPGFECAEGSPTPACRRYCCSGSCEGYKGQNGGPTYCDVIPLIPKQQAFDGKDVKAPVCMPFKKCELLSQGTCGALETCAIVTDKGDTGCVSRGPAKVDESCEREQCDVDLTCLGTVGDRRCFKLCRVRKAEIDCAPNQKCVTGAVFRNTEYGVCK